MGFFRLFRRAARFTPAGAAAPSSSHFRALRAGLRRALLALPLVAAAGPVLAQGYSCQQLEASLSALDRGNAAAASQQNQAARLRADLDRLTAQSRGMNCDGPRGFLIFQGPPKPPECDQISDQISRIRSQLAGLDRGGSDQAGQRRALILALAQNNCGPQYTAAARAVTSQPQQQQRPRNFFEAIFGGPVQSDPEESSPGLDAYPAEPSKPSYSRAVCVRTCDGYFFPLGQSTNSSRFAQDEALCKRLCPNAEVQLFTYGGEDIRHAVSTSGTPYMSLANALRYRKEYVSSCSCRAPGQSWAQALAGLEDKTTLRKGDILVTEEQAREMSQPKFDTPAAAKGKTASGKPAVAADAPQAPATATTEAPLAPASEQPGQRAVRVIPLPRSQNAQPQPAQ